MDPNYQPPAHLDVFKLTIRQPSPRLNPNNNDNAVIQVVSHLSYTLINAQFQLKN